MKVHTCVEKLRYGYGHFGGPCPCIRRDETLARRHRALTVQCRSWFKTGDTGETKSAAHRFAAIRMRALDDPHRSSLSTVQTVTPLRTPPGTCRGKRRIRPHPPANSDSRSMG